MRPDPSKGYKISIVLLPEFSDLVLTLVRELLRISQLTSACRFDVALHSADGRPVRASNGHRFDVEASFEGTDRLDAMLVCASYNPMTHVDQTLMASLRRQHRHGALIAAVDTGPLILAEAGLLDDRRATVHWDELAVARRRYPKVDFVSALVERDGPFLTSCGSLGTIEFALEIIAHFAGRHVAEMVVGLTGRNRVDDQLGTTSQNLAKAVQLMGQNIETPLSIAQIASSVGLSQRQLARQFLTEFSLPPVKYYTRMRLELADELLRKTRFPISEIATASGFSSLSWFSQSYRNHFGRPPSTARARD